MKKHSEDLEVKVGSTPLSQLQNNLKALKLLKKQVWTVT